MNFSHAGPLPETVTDFWWLMWQEQVHVVAMVTNTVERGQKKCEQYWPEEGTQEYGPFKVTLTDQQVFADYTIRQLFVTVSFPNLVLDIHSLHNLLHEQQYTFATYELQNSIAVHNWYMSMYRPLGP